MWWEDPVLPSAWKKPRTSDKKYNDPSMIEAVSYKRRSKLNSTGRFAPSRQWKPYAGMGTDDAGYICTLYSIKEIGRRYGLSVQNQSYWKKNVLPVPIDVVLRRGTRMHHWSRIQLMVLDEILRFMEKNGHLQLTKRHEEAIDLLHHGCAVMADYYHQRYDTESISSYDKFGVSFE